MFFCFFPIKISNSFVHIFHCAVHFFNAFRLPGRHTDADFYDGNSYAVHMHISFCLSPCVWKQMCQFIISTLKSQSSESHSWGNGELPWSLIYLFQGGLEIEFEESVTQHLGVLMLHQAGVEEGEEKATYALNTECF